MDWSRLLDAIDAVAALALFSAIPVVFLVPSAAPFTIVSVLVAPGVLIATALLRSPRDRLQCSLAAGAYVAEGAAAVGLQRGGIFRYVGLALVILVVALATALALRAVFRLRLDGPGRAAGRARAQPVGGKARGSGIVPPDADHRPTDADRAPTVAERRPSAQDGPIVFPSRPRLRAIAMRLTLLPFLLALVGAIVLAYAGVLPDGPGRPLLEDHGVQVIASVAAVPALLHAGSLGLQRGLARLRTDGGDDRGGDWRWGDVRSGWRSSDDRSEWRWTDVRSGWRSDDDRSEWHRDDARGEWYSSDVRRSEWRWAVAHVAAWASLLCLLAVETYFVSGTGTLFAAWIATTLFLALGALAVLATALGLAIADVHAVRAAGQRQPGSVSD